MNPGAAMHETISDFCGTPQERVVNSTASRAVNSSANERGPNSRRSSKPHELSGQRVLAACGDSAERRAQLSCHIEHAQGCPGGRRRSGPVTVRALSALRCGETELHFAVPLGVGRVFLAATLGESPSSEHGRFPRGIRNSPVTE